MGATLSSTDSRDNPDLSLLDLPHELVDPAPPHGDSADGIEAGFASAAASTAASQVPDETMLPPPPAPVMEYRLGGRVLGEGAFGKVRLATSIRTGHQVAVKIIKRKQMDERAELLLKREVDNHEKLRHTNIVRLHTWVRTPSKYYLVMEYCSLGDCLDYVNKAAPLTDVDARGLFKQLIEGLAFCHSLGCYHRDLKLENLMLCPADPVGTHTAAVPTLKIADFGLSALVPVADLCGTMCGSPMYAAPELFGGGSAGEYDASRSDMWSCGVILYAFLCGNMPFDADDVRTLIGQIRSGVPCSAVPAWRGQSARGLVHALLSLVPEDRPAAAAVLGDEWLRLPPPICASTSVPLDVGGGAAEIGEWDGGGCDDLSSRRGVTESADFFKAMLRREREAQERTAAPRPPPVAELAEAEGMEISRQASLAAPEVVAEPAPSREPGMHLTRSELAQIRAEMVRDESMKRQREEYEQANL